MPLLDGRVLIAGGYGGDGAVAEAEMYHDGVQVEEAWRPVLDASPDQVALGRPLALTGSGLTGVSSASGGNGVRDSSSGYPVVLLSSLVNEALQVVPPAGSGWSEGGLETVPLEGLPPGHALLSVIVNGVPSRARMVLVTDARGPTPTASPSATSEPTVTPTPTRPGPTATPGGPTPTSGGPSATPTARAAHFSFVPYASR
jgi:hypothetical protein